MGAAQSRRLQGRLHPSHHGQADKGVKPAVDADHVSPGPCDPDSAVLHADALAVTRRPWAKQVMGGPRQLQISPMQSMAPTVSPVSRVGHFYRPLQLCDMAEELEDEKIHPAGHKGGHA